MKIRSSVLLLLLCFPAVAQAHPVGGGNGFASGLAHPVLGLDHLLAMVAVGILGVQMGGRAIWTIPAVFVGVMLIGGVMGMAGIPFFSVELGIAASVLVLGIGLAVAKKFPAIFAMLAVGFFALFHGHAHGTEMPHIAAPAFYAAGFVLATLSVHMSGICVGLVSRGLSHGPQLMRYLGAGIAGIGLHMIVA